MTRAQTVELLKLITSLDQRRAFGAPEVESWHQVLGDLDYQDCRDAVILHYRASDACLMPAAIRAHVDSWKAHATPVSRAIAIPDADPDDVSGYPAALRGRRFRQQPAHPDDGSDST